MSKTLIHAQARLVDAVQGKKERGATMVEYGLLVAFIAIIALVGVKLLGQNLLALFNGITF